MDSGKCMSAHNSLIERYHALKAWYLRVLALRIEQTPFELGQPNQLVTLELLKKDLSGKIVITFSGVQSLQVANVDPGILCCLDIASVVADQLEGLNYRVCSTEQDLTLSFYCRDFELIELPL